MSLLTSLLLATAPLAPLSANPDPSEPGHAGDPLAVEGQQRPRGSDDRGAEPERWIWYDSFEGGRMHGGRVRERAGDRMLSRVEPPAMAAMAGGGGATTVWSSGPPSNRVDLVYVGDGYTADELFTYVEQVDAGVAHLLSEPPFDVYANLLNVHRVDVISAESGVDNHPSKPSERDTALDMTFWCNGIMRLLCVDLGKAHQYANQAPGKDQVIAIANSWGYGAAGYTFNDVATYAAGNSDALDLAMHELGHSFGNLGDEYWKVGHTYTGPEPLNANLTTLSREEMLAQGSKWHLWLSEANVDVIEGADDHEFGLYRPTMDSKMRSIERPFEQVNLEQLVAEIYRVVDPIDDVTAPGNYDESMVFNVDPVDPVGHSLDVTWLLDGEAIPGATGTTFSPASLALADGVYELSVEVVDPTPLVRDPVLRDQLLTSRRDWTIGVGVPVNPPLIDSVGSVDSASSETDTFLVTGEYLAHVTSVTVGTEQEVAFEVLDANTLRVGPLGATPPSRLDLSLTSPAGTTKDWFGVKVLPVLSAAIVDRGWRLVSTLDVGDDPAVQDVGFLFLGFGLSPTPIPVDQATHWGLELSLSFPIVDLGGKVFSDTGSWWLPLPWNPEFSGVPIYLQAWSARGPELEGKSFSNVVIDYLW